MGSKIINFFSTKVAKEKILTNTLSESLIFLYFFIIFMFDALGLTLQAWFMIGKQPLIADVVNMWSYLVLNAIGLIIFFIANDGSKGKNFLSKFFTFSFTVGYKYLIILIILSSFAILVPDRFVQPYEILIYHIINFLMIINIAYRIYQTR